MQNSQSKNVADKLSAANRVLITVSHDPTVDQLTAAMALALVLDKREVKTSTVYSGVLPRSLKFLDADKVVEKNVDSLRDFIIALHKAKATKFRYKEDGDFVKIYITPNKGKVNESDLMFEQGDFNVDTVVCIGVHSRDDVDSVIKRNDRVLHNASIITVNSGNTPGDMGTTNWSDNTAVALSEMIYELIKDLGIDLVDQHVADVLLTGIISSTDHFRSAATTPAIMTVAAELMSRGADQAEINQHLETGVKPPAKKHKPTPSSKPHSIRDTAKRPSRPSVDTSKHSAKPMSKKPRTDKPSSSGANDHGQPVPKPPKTAEHKPAAMAADDSLAPDVKSSAPKLDKQTDKEPTPIPLQGSDLTQLHNDRQKGSDAETGDSPEPTPPTPPPKPEGSPPVERAPEVINPPAPTPPPIISPPAASPPPPPAPTPPPAPLDPPVQAAPTAPPPPPAQPQPTPSLPDSAPAPVAGDTDQALADARAAVEQAMSASSGATPVSPPTPAGPPAPTPSTAPSPPSPPASPPPNIQPPSYTQLAAPTPPPGGQFTVPQSNYGQYAPPQALQQSTEWMHSRESPANLGVATPHQNNPLPPPLQ